MLFLAFIGVFLVLWAIVYAVLPAVRHLGRLLAGLIARNARATRFVSTTRDRFKNYLPVAAIVIAGGLFTAWAGDAFIDLAEKVHGNNAALQKIDTSIHDWAVRERTSGATTFFTMMTIIGGPAGLAILLTIIAIILAIRRRWSWLIYLAVTAGGGALLNLELKRYFARARPIAAEMLRRANGYSFPSGHAMGSAVAFGALAYLAFRAIKNWPAKAAVIAFLYTLVASIALSRVYLGVHWISDVLAGVTVGTVWVTTTTVAYETLRRIRRLRGKAEVRTPRS
ncbi:MAG TPA: phosphatase PAP2 family protein [Thermoanaerobaculia bacterium]|nr:phosphatase PAP2 family protein [Thermoanaerobaculia bacterium]